MKSKEEDGTGLANCSEGKGTMTAWWRWNDNLKGREDSDDLKPHGKGWWKKNPAGPRSGAQRKTGLDGERKLKPYASHGAERTN